MTPLQEGYAALVDGDPQALSDCRIPARIVARAAAARNARALTPSPVASAPRVPLAIAAAARAPAAPPRPSRAALAAEIHGVAINASRTRAGLQPLSVTELEHEFSEVDRLPAPRTKLSRREAGNAMAQRLGGSPKDQAGIDGMWTGIAEKLNATKPSSATPSAGPASRAPQSRVEVDNMWSSLAADLNKKAGIARTPVGDRAR